MANQERKSARREDENLEPIEEKIDQALEDVDDDEIDERLDEALEHADDSDPDELLHELEEGHPSEDDGKSGSAGRGRSGGKSGAKKK